MPMMAACLVVSMVGPVGSGEPVPRRLTRLRGLLVREGLAAQSDLAGLPAQVFPFSEATLRTIHIGQVVHQCEGLRVLSAQHTETDQEGPTIYVFRFFEASLRVDRAGQAGHRRESLRVLTRLTDLDRE